MDRNPVELAALQIGASRKNEYTTVGTTCGVVEHHVEGF